MLCFEWKICRNDRQVKFYAIIAFWLTLINVSHGEIVSVFSDVHNNVNNSINSFRFMRANGVTHIIGLGDFGSGRSLKEILLAMTEIASVEKENIYFVPGNHDSQYFKWGTIPRLRNYGNVVNLDDSDSATVVIDGKRIKVSH